MAYMWWIWRVWPNLIVSRVDLAPFMLASIRGRFLFETGLYLKKYSKYLTYMQVHCWEVISSEVLVCKRWDLAYSWTFCSTKRRRILPCLCSGFCQSFWSRVVPCLLWWWQPRKHPLPLSHWVDSLQWLCDQQHLDFYTFSRIRGKYFAERRRFFLGHF